MLSIDMDVVIHRAEQKQRLVQQFLELTEEQAAAIAREDYEAVLSLISKKQNIMEKINLLELQRPIYTGPNGELLQSIYARIKMDLARALERDNQNIDKIRSNHSVIAEKIRDNQTRRATHALYTGKGMHMEGVLVDRVK